MVTAQLGNVDQSVDLVGKLNKSSESCDLGHVALHNIADFVQLVDVRPGIFLSLLQTKRDTLLLRIDLKDHNFNFLSGLQHFVGSVHLTGPAHVRDVDHTVDVVLDLNKSTVVGHVADLAGDVHTHRIFLSKNFPRIALFLTQSQRDLVAVDVDLKHNGFHFVTDVQNVRSFGNALGPAHFSQVDQTFHSVFDLNKSTVGHQVADLTGHAAAFGILLSNTIPGIGGALLQTQRNTLFVTVDTGNDDLQLLSHMEHFAGMLDALPGDVGDMQQSVDAAQINESTKINDVLHDTGADVINVHFRQKLAALTLQGLFKQLAAGNHDVVTVDVDLDDLQIKLFADVVFHIAHGTNIKLGTGKEGREAFHVDHDTAFDAVTHEALDDVTFAVFGGDTLPGAGGVGLFKAQGGSIVAVFKLFEVDFDLIAHIHFVVFQKFRGRNGSGSLVSDLNGSGIGTLLNDLSLDDGSLVEL